MSVWVVRAGQGSEIIDEVREQGVVAIGWAEMGDCSQYKTRQDFREAYERAYPEDTNPHRIGGQAGQVYRFVREVAVGDIVLCPNSPAREVLIGEVSGDYQYDSERIEGYVHLRSVEWRKSVSRDDMMAELRRKSSGDLTVFTVQGVDTEVQRLLEGGPLEEDESEDGRRFYEETRAEAEELIWDVIAGIDWQDFQDLVAALLRAMGFRTTVSPPGPDGGKDIVAHPDALGFEQPRIKVQVKHTKASVGAPDIRNFRAVLAPAEKGLFVSTGGFARGAEIEPDRAGPQLTLMDRDQFVDLLTEYYEKLEPEYQAMVPLKKVYVPIKVE